MGGGDGELCSIDASRCGIFASMMADKAVKHRFELIELCSIDASLTDYISRERISCTLPNRAVSLVFLPSRKLRTRTITLVPPHNHMHVRIVF